MRISPTYTLLVNHLVANLTYIPSGIHTWTVVVTLLQHYTVSLYNYYIPSVGSRTPFTVSVTRSLPLRANDAYYIMPQPLLALGCFTADVATYILQPVDWLARSASVPLRRGETFCYTRSVTPISA